MLHSITSIILVGLVAIAGGAALAADPTAIQIGYATPVAGPHGAGAKGFEEELNRLAPGRFKVQHFPGGALGGEREMVESLQLGTLQMAIRRHGGDRQFRAGGDGDGHAVPVPRLGARTRGSRRRYRQRDSRQVPPTRPGRAHVR